MMLKRVQPFSRIIMIEESLVAPKNVLRRSDIMRKDSMMPKSVQRFSDDIMRKEKIRT
jgi:hypothetical protein